MKMELVKSKAKKNSRPFKSNLVLSSHKQQQNKIINDLAENSITSIDIDFKSNDNDSNEIWPGNEASKTKSKNDLKPLLETENTMFSIRLQYDHLFKKNSARSTHLYTDLNSDTHNKLTREKSLKNRVNTHY
jgi:hypothetical protein